MADFKEGLVHLPEHMREGVTRYVEDGTPPGHFLRAVLENDLVTAAGRADMVNAHALATWGQYVRDYLPSDAHGSPEAVAAWIAHQGLRQEARR